MAEPQLGFSFVEFSFTLPGIVSYFECVGVEISVENAGPNIKLEGMSSENVFTKASRYISNGLTLFVE